VLSVLLLIMLVLLVYLLFVKLVLEVNTSEHKVAFRIGNIISAAVDENYDVLKLQVIWWKRKYELAEWANVGSKNELRSNSRNRVQKRKVNTAALWRVIRSFRVRKCEVDLDTGDMPLNGVLFPIFYGIRFWSGKKVGINFSGRNIIIIKIENTLARMLWAYIKS